MALISDRPLIINDDLKKFFENLWHVDVQKDHGSDYDERNVNALIPGGGGGSTAGGKEGLFGTLILNNDGKSIPDAYRKFQNAEGLVKDDTKVLTGIPSIKIAFTGYEYDYKYFDRPTDQQKYTDVASQINEFLGGRNVLRYTDTSRGGWEFLCRYPADKLYHANTREVESDPASKLSIGSFKGDDCIAKGSNIYFYEPATNPPFITYTKWDDTDVTKNSAISAFYCSKTLVMKLKGSDSGKGKLNVQLTFYNTENKLVEITEKMNIASSFKKLVANLKTFLNITTPDELKQAVFISKHHGDVGQVLSPFYPRSLVNITLNKIINTGKFFCIFESYDVNPVLKAFSMGLDGIWFHTSPGKEGGEQRIIIFKRRGGVGDDPALFLQYLKDQLISEKAKAVSYLGTYEAAVVAINTALERFKKMFNAYFTEWVNEPASDDDTVNALAKAWRDSVKGEGNLDKRYGMILQKGSQFAVVSKSLPQKPLDDFSPADIDTINALDISGDIQSLKLSLDTISTILQKYKFPKEQLGASQNIFNGATNDLVVTSIQKDIAVISDASYKSFSKKTMANMWSFINLSGGRSRVVSFEPKRIAAYGLKAIHLIKKSLDEFDPTYTTSFIDFLKAGFEVANGGTAEITSQLTEGLRFIGIGGDAQINLRGGKRRTRRKQKGGQQKQLQMLAQRDIQLEVFYELLKDLQIYFTFALDNLANPKDIYNQTNTFLKEMYGGELDFIADGNLRGGGEEEFIAAFDTMPILSVEHVDTFFEVKPGEQTYEFGMLSPQYAHITDLLKNMCQTYSIAERGGRIDPVKQRNTLYNLLVIIQQFSVILNMKKEEPEELREEIEALQKELTSDVFDGCGIFKDALKNAVTSEQFRALEKEALNSVANRLIAKSREAQFAYGAVPAPEVTARGLFAEEVSNREAANKRVPLPAPLKIIYFRNIPQDLQKRLISAESGGETNPRANRYKTVKANLEDTNPAYTRKEIMNKGITSANLTTYGVREESFRNEPVYEGGARNTRRKRKNETKRRRRSKSKSKHGVHA